MKHLVEGGRRQAFRLRGRSCQAIDQDGPARADLDRAAAAPTVVRRVDDSSFLDLQCTGGDVDRSREPRGVGGYVDSGNTPWVENGSGPPLSNVHKVGDDLGRSGIATLLGR